MPQHHSGAKDEQVLCFNGTVTVLSEMLQSIKGGEQGFIGGVLAKRKRE